MIKICGIVGIINPKGINRSDIKDFIRMMIRAQIRGTDASGCFNSDLKLVKSPRSFERGLARTRKFIRFINESLGSYYLVGHTRMATQGTPRKNTNNHPFKAKTRIGEMVLVHNGWVDSLNPKICDTLQIVRDLRKQINRGLEYPYLLYDYNIGLLGSAVLAIGTENSLVLSREGYNNLVFTDNMLKFASTGEILGEKHFWVLVNGSYQEYTFPSPDHK